MHRVFDCFASSNQVGALPTFSTKLITSMGKNIKYFKIVWPTENSPESLTDSLCDMLAGGQKTENCVIPWDTDNLDDELHEWLVFAGWNEKDNVLIDIIHDHETEPEYFREEKTYFTVEVSCIGISEKLKSTLETLIGKPLIGAKDTMEELRFQGTKSETHLVKWLEKQGWKHSYPVLLHIRW